MDINFTNLADDDDFDAYASSEEEGNQHDDYYFGVEKELKVEEKKTADYAATAEGKKNRRFSQTEQKKYVEAVYAIENMDENLGENFEETPWLPPSVGKAVSVLGVIST